VLEVAAVTKLLRNAFMILVIPGRGVVAPARRHRRDGRTRVACASPRRCRGS
jgi:hypothetical protein